MKYIIQELMQRYAIAICRSRDSELLNQMSLTLLDKCEDWPVDKLNRWLGFIQGVLFTEGLIDIDTERDYTRPLFHQYYKSNNIDIPDSVNF